MKAILYNKHTPLIEVTMERKQIVNIGKVTNEELLPFILQGNLSLESINKWLSKRLIPERREGLREVRMKFHDFDRDKHLNSLTDQYWFRLRGEKWDDINYFTNKYSEDVGNMFFTPWLVPKRYTTNSPDLTTNGALIKRWVQNEDLTSALYKTASETYHQEPLSEVLASIVAKKLNIIPFVEYQLAISGMILCSKCQNFITENTEFVPAYELYLKDPKKQTDTAYSHLLRLCEQYHIPNMEDFLKGMILIDSITGNTDRHLGNFGFIREVTTGKFLGPAPLFDNGTAFWCWEAKPNVKKKSRLFAREENFVLSSMKDIYKGVLNKENLDVLIEKYPLITDERKDILKKSIHERSTLLERTKRIKERGLER